MRTSLKLHLYIARLACMLALSLSALFAGAQTHKIVLPPAAPPAPNLAYNFQMSTAIPVNTAAVGVQTAIASVAWDFGFPPAGGVIAGRVLTVQGITITLPADPGVAISSAEVVKIAGTPTATTSFSFEIKVSTTDFLTIATQSFDVFIRQPTDVVLVLDRSGSMTGSTPSGTRWNSLREAATNFMLKYEQLKPQDRTGITYFSTDATPVSTCCNTLIANTPSAPLLSAKINTELGQPAFQPGGSTAMGKGLKNATTKLSDATRARNIILITDGEQNVDPQVRTDGTGYTDGSTIPGGMSPGGIRIMTLGIGSPSGAFHTTLSNLAIQNRGSYYVTDDGADFTFQNGTNAGDMSTGFTTAFINALSDASPQLIDVSTHSIPANNTPVVLQTFPLNNHVEKLLLEFVVGRKFEGTQIVQLLGRIKVEKDGVSVLQYARPAWTQSYTNTLLLTFDFNNPPQGLSSLASAGTWKVSIIDSTLKLGNCKLTSIADDHRLHMHRTLLNKNAKVNVDFPVSFNLDWLQHPIKNAKIDVAFFRPGEDLGDALANNPTTVNVSKAPDASSPGVQKYDSLWKDSTFRNKFKTSENTVTLTHTADGKYDGIFKGLTVSGLYRIVYRITGTDSAGGKIQRVMIESFYTSFSSLDMSKSAVSVVMQNGQLVMSIRPKTSYNKFIGPAMGNAFTVTNPGIKISNIIDHQDGKYTITFTGNVNDTTSLVLLGQPIFSGKLADAGKTSGGGLGQWLADHGIPFWLFWLVVILLLLFIIWLIVKKK